MTHFIPSRICSAPPDEGQSSLRDTIRKSSFKIDANEFVPIKHLNPVAHEFIPTFIHSNLSSDAPVFESSKLNLQASEFLPAFKPDNIEEKIKEEKFMIVENRELSENETQGSLDISEPNIQVDVRHVYTYDEIFLIKEGLEKIEDFFTITTELSLFSNRPIFAKKKEYKHASKKQRSKSKE